jgi:phospholipase/lecithinase/hemolysin
VTSVFREPRSMTAYRISNKFSTRRNSLKALAAASIGAGLMLAGCGSGSTFEPLVPTRVVSFGDGWSYVGLTNNRFTVNDSSVNIWVEQLAVSYGLTLTPASSGGFSYAQGGALVDSGGNSIKAQIDQYLSDVGNQIDSNHLVVVDPGLSQLAALAADPANSDDSKLRLAADLAGRALAAQVQRLTAAGGKHVVIANAADLGKTPYAATIPAPITDYSKATEAFNFGLKEALSVVTANVLLVDNEAYINLLHAAPTLLGSDGVATGTACTVAVSTCTPATTNSIRNYDLFLYADELHITPKAHRLLGINAYDKIKARW